MKLLQLHAVYFLASFSVIASDQNLRTRSDALRNLNKESQLSSRDLKEGQVFDEESPEIIDDESPTKVLDALVIGAGWAGIAAARKMLDKGLDFVVLEGRDYLGGRSKTAMLSDGSSSVELGSQWIHGAKTENPVFKCVREEANLTTIRVNYDYGVWSNAYGKPGPHRIPNKEVEALFKKEYTKGFFKFQEFRQYNSNQDSNLRLTANDYIKEAKLNEDERLFLEFALEHSIEAEYAASLRDLSMWWWNTAEEIRGKDVMIEQGENKGYSGAVSGFAAPVTDRIMLQTEVTAVDWTRKIPIVEYRQDGVMKKVRARHVIITVPLGVLKAGTISFRPSLPRGKRQAIDRLGMGLLNKCVLKWSANATLPWPDDLEWLEKIAAEGEQERWTLFHNEQPSHNNSILIAFSAGREAQRIEKLPDAEIQNEVMLSLQDMFGDTVPEPEEVIVTRWGSDKFSRGSYSFHEEGSNPEDRKILAAAVKKRLFFAGEATNAKYPSTTHGALISGLKAGKRVAKVAMKRRRLMHEAPKDTKDTVSYRQEQLINILEKKFYKSNSKP